MGSRSFVPGEQGVGGWPELVWIERFAKYRVLKMDPNYSDWAFNYPGQFNCQSRLSTPLGN